MLFNSVYLVGRTISRLTTSSSTTTKTRIHNITSIAGDTTRRLFSGSLASATSRMDNRAKTLVTAQWVASNINKVKVVDASWCMPHEKKDIYADYAKARIPGAVLFDIDVIADKSVNLPHMLPSVNQFESDVGKLGISNDDVIVAYDSSGKFVASARVWWTFRVFGHKDVVVLDGGLPQWLKLGLPLESGAASTPTAAKYKATLNAELVKNMEHIKKNIESKEYELVDARPTDRFNGVAPEPRPGLRSGHIPNSKSVPAMSIVDVNNLTFPKNEDIMNIFKSKGVNVSAPIITTCGSGVTASVLSLGLHLCGIDSAVYDGSFSEWGQPSLDTPVKTSPPPQ